METLAACCTCCRYSRTPDRRAPYFHCAYDDWQQNASSLGLNDQSHNGCRIGHDDPPESRQDWVS